MACPPPEFDWSSWATWSCLREDIAPFFAPIVAFIAAAIVARPAWRQAKAAWAQASTARERHEEQTKADLERRITESFARAVEQLGSDKLATRLGGIYTLERISRESKHLEEYWTVIETLTAYVREALYPPRQAAFHSSAQFQGRGTVESAAESPSSDEPADQEKEPKPGTDIQAILTVLGRRKKEMRDREGEDQHLDLSVTDLRGLDLSDAHLEGAFLGGAHLEEAFLSRAHFERAYLSGAHLKGAYLGSAHLEGANLEEANLEDTDLSGAHLKNAYLEEANLEGANLEHANLSGAYLGSALLSRVHFEHADLSGAHLEGARKLTQEQINSALGNENTILPKGLKRPAHWTEPPEPAN